MYVKRLLDAKKSAKCQYNRFLKLWHNEMLFKSSAIGLLMVINIVLLIYVFNNLENINSLYLPKFFKMLSWFLILLYCGLLVDVETSKVMKICFSIILMINFVYIEVNYFILGIIIDFLNFGILWCIFKYDEIKMDSNESYKDEYILPLISNDQKLLDAYNELWKNNSAEDLRSYNGLFVTRYVILSCSFLTILIINVIDKYTNIDKKTFFNMKGIIEIQNFNFFQRTDNYLRIPVLNRQEIISLQIILITFIILVKYCYKNIVSCIPDIRKITQQSNIIEVEGSEEEKKSILETNTSIKTENETLENENEIEDYTKNLFQNKWISNTVFFFNIFLFGMLTFDNIEFDLTSHIFVIKHESIIILCIFLPLIGLLTELSMLRSWNWYFIFTLIIYNLKIWIDIPIVNSFITLISGILFNISIILFICNSKKNVNKKSEYPYVLYILYKIFYFIGSQVMKYLILSTILNQNLNKFSVIINLIIIINISFSFYWNSVSNSNTIQENESEIEWEVTY